MADPRDEALRKRYRELATEEPSAAIDDAIRAAARRAVSSAPGGARRPMRWAVPASVAAVLFLSFGVVMRMEKEVPSLEADLQTRAPEAARVQEPARELAPPAPKPMPAPAPQFVPAPKKERAAEPPAPVAKLQAKTGEGFGYQEREVAPGARAKDSALRDEAPAVAERVAPADKRLGLQKESNVKQDAPVAKTEAAAPAEAAGTTESKMAADAIAPAKPEAVTSSSRVKAVIIPPKPAASPAAPAAPAAPPPASIASPSTVAPPPSPGAFEEQRRANVLGRSDEGRAAAGALAQPAPRQDPDPWPATPEKKLERIAELRKAGRDREADEALARFKREHPDYRIPDATWERIKPR